MRIFVSFVANPVRISFTLLMFWLSVAVPVAIAATDYRQAPEWDVSEWINGPGVTVRELRGKVVIVDFFQLWCPGCNRFSIPLMEKWKETFGGALRSGKLVMVSVHTVFEGHDYQNPARLKEFLLEKGIDHLVGIDRHRSGSEIPETMKIFHTRGTPEMAIIDKQGNIRFQRFGGFDVEAAEQFIRRLLNESVT
ncbi:MAG: TlpA family protein disulfide reductase [Gammaproteobacteria bacterium]|nr:TlpA family protein disulfide reductase [Gammaproteobacteria bacterium]